MLVGELAMFLGRGGVILRVFVLAHLVMMRGLMMVMRGGVVVSGGGVMVLARRMFGRFGHDYLLLPVSGRAHLD
jgi:hypothetical protein